MSTKMVPLFPGPKRQRIQRFLETLFSLNEVHSDQKHGRSILHVISTCYFLCGISPHFVRSGDISFFIYLYTRAKCSHMVSIRKRENPGNEYFTVVCVCINQSICERTVGNRSAIEGQTVNIKNLRTGLWSTYGGILNEFAHGFWWIPAKGLWRVHRQRRNA